MKNAKRVLAFASMTLAAGAMLGIAPAQAAPTTTAQSSGTAAPASSPYWDWDDEYVVGYFYNPWQCYEAGDVGQDYGAWRDYYCFPAYVPGWGSVWVLQVEEQHWYWNRWHGGWPKSWPHKPSILGKPFQVGGAYQHPFKNRQGIRYGKVKGIPFNPYQRYNGPKDYLGSPSNFEPPYQGGSYQNGHKGYPGYPGEQKGYPSHQNGHKGYPSHQNGHKDYQNGHKDYQSYQKDYQSYQKDYLVTQSGQKSSDVQQQPDVPATPPGLPVKQIGEHVMDHQQMGQQAGERSGQQDAGQRSGQQDAGQQDTGQQQMGQRTGQRRTGEQGGGQRNNGPLGKILGIGN